MKDSLNQKTLKQFDWQAKWYDLFSWYFTPFYNRMHEVIPDLNGKKILSVGAGTATFEIALAQKYPDAHIVCADISKKMINRAKAKAVGIDNIVFDEEDAESLSYENDSFDLLICSHSFHHYAQQHIALMEFRRVVKDGGSCLLVDAVKDGLLGKIWTFIIEHVLEPGVKHYSSSTLISMLTSAGFSDISKQHIQCAYTLMTAR